MKKVLYNIAAVISLLFCATSCYDEVVQDYTFSAAYFAQQQPLRSVIWGRTGEAEANEISVGAAIAGKLEIDLDDWVRFEVEQSSIESTMGMTFDEMGLTVMPENYYNFSDPNKMVITKANLFIADVDVSFTDDFFNDPEAIDCKYAIPIVLLESSCDSILSTKYYSVVAVKYQSKYAGTYYVQGYTVERSGQSYGEVVSYNDPDLSQNITVTTTTTARNAISRTGQTLSIGTLTIENGNVNITVPEDGEVSYDEDGIGWVDVEVTAADGDNMFVSGTGSGRMCYDEDTHDCIIEISYLATDGGSYYEVSETLTRRQDPLDDLRVEFWVAPDDA